MDINDLPVKNELRQNETAFMIIFKRINGHNVSYKIPISVFKKFYINASFLDKMKQTMDQFRADIDSVISLMPSKDSIDAKYMLKKDSNYKRSRLLTEDRLMSLLGEYCTGERIDIDIQNCMEHSRSVANVIGSSLASIAATARSTNAIKSNNTSNTDTVVEAMQSISETSGEDDEEE